jgi:hypothetical protein
VIVQCENCGAPLDIKGSEMSVTCSYCGRANQVRKMKTLHAINPAGWAPPPMWSPPPQISPQPLRYTIPPARTGGGFAGCLVALMILGITAVAAGIPLYQAGLLNWLPFFGWDGKEPFRCGGNDSVRIHDVHANLPNATAITIEANCEAEIENSEIVAWEGIRADGNRRVVIRNSTIRATGVGIRSSGNKEIELDNSTVIAGGIGIDADAISHITVAGGRVVGTPLAVQTSSLASFENRGATIFNGTSIVAGEGAPAAAVPSDVCERAHMCCEGYVQAMGAGASTCASVANLHGPAVASACQTMIDSWRRGLEGTNHPIPPACQ